MNYERENFKQDKQHPQWDDTKAVPSQMLVFHGLWLQ